MRHFFGYRADGVLGSMETYGGGWPHCNCHPNCELLADPECRKESVVSLRTRRADRNPDIVGFILYDCPCPPEDKTCEQNCINQQMAHYYVDLATKSFVAKPVTNFHIDGQALVPDQKLDLVPGTPVNFKIVGPDVPDGETVRMGTLGQFDVFVEDLDPFIDLEFQGGETSVMQLHPPPQGAKVTLVITGKYVRPQRVCVRGWSI